MKKFLTYLFIFMFLWTVRVCSSPTDVTRFLESLTTEQSKTAKIVHTDFPKRFYVFYEI